MAMGRIEQTLLDGGDTPTDLRPSPATPPYHKKRQMFLSNAKGRSLVGWGLRPYEYPGATSTSLECALRRSCARPTGDTHGRTTGPPILLISIRFPLKTKEGRDTPAKDTPARLP